MEKVGEGKGKNGRLRGREGERGGERKNGRLKG